jgi:hypothetical protein
MYDVIASVQHRSNGILGCYVLDAKGERLAHKFEKQPHRWVILPNEWGATGCAYARFLLSVFRRFGRLLPWLPRHILPRLVLLSPLPMASIYFLVM